MTERRPMMVEETAHRSRKIVWEVALDDSVAVDLPAGLAPRRRHVRQEQGAIRVALE